VGPQTTDEVALAGAYPTNASGALAPSYKPTCSGRQLVRGQKGTPCLFVSVRAGAGGSKEMNEMATSQKQTLRQRALAAEVDEKAAATTLVDPELIESARRYKIKQVITVVVGALGVERDEITVLEDGRVEVDGLRFGQWNGTRYPALYTPDDDEAFWPVKSLAHLAEVLRYADSREDRSWREFWRGRRDGLVEDSKNARS
jgi:hypothetical protein